MRPFIPISFLLCASLNAQTIFAPIGARWTYEEHFAFISDSALVTIESIADTVLQGETCKVLALTGQISCTQAYRYVYASNDTVFFWDPSWNQFSVLYVMNAVPGQMWDMKVSVTSLGVTGTAGVTTAATSTTVISGLTLRVLTNAVDLPGMYYYGTGTVIERIGDLRYLFPWGSGICDGDYITALRCYEDPDITWLNSQLPQCDLITGIGEHATAEAFRIAPSLAEVGNPILLSTSDGSIRSYRLVDMIGRTVALGSLANGTVTLHLPHAGAYMVMPEPIGAFAAQRVVVY